MPSIKAHADISNKARGLNFGLSLHLHQYLLYASNQGSGGSTQTCADWREPSLLADVINIKILGIVPFLSYMQQIQDTSVLIHLFENHAYFNSCLIVSSTDNLYKKSLDADQAWQNVGPDLDPTCLSLTRDRGAAGSSLTGVTALWSLSKTHLS